MSVRNDLPANFDVAEQLQQHVHRMLPTHRKPTSSGEMLLHEFLEPLGMTQMELARRMGVSYPRVNEIVKGRRGITPDTALRLARLFGTTAEFWLNGQQAWDLWHATHADSAAEILMIEPLPIEEDEDENEELGAAAD